MGGRTSVAVVSMGGCCSYKSLLCHRESGLVEIRSRCTSNAPSACPPPSRRARGRSRSASGCAVASPPAPVFSTMISCELLVDPHCDFKTSFAETGGQWTVQSRAAFDPELRRDAAKAVAPLPPVISTANYFQHEGDETNVAAVVGSQAGARLCGSSHHHFLSRSWWVWRGHRYLAGRLNARRRCSCGTTSLSNCSRLRSWTRRRLGHEGGGV